MDAYYQAQINSSSAFSGPGRQLGSGALGAMALRMGRVTLPLLKKYVFPIAKTIGKELLMQTLPELANIVTKKKSVKRAMKDAGARTIKSTITSTKAPAKRKRAISVKSTAKRSRKDIFAGVRT
jgi:hypothetical protein